MIQWSTAFRNSMLDSFEANIGASPVLKIRTGPQPADGDTADSGSVLCSYALPTDWMAAASGATKAKNGTWSGAASAGGTAGHYRIYAADGTTVMEQGSVTASGGGGDLTVDSVAFANGQTFTVTGYTKTAPHA